MPDTNKREELSLDDSVKVSSKGNPILGVLEGPCADIIEPTRNGRKYDDTLWEKVFNNEIIKEYFECGGIFGELGHPLDRTETDMEKIAICMPQPPHKDKDGVLLAKFDILDTPNGRIAYTLARYGYKLGVSSRGSGDTYTAMDGEEHVDEDTYDFQAFDLVLLPAVKKARLNLVNESLNNDSMFNHALCEAINKSTDDEKKIMTETLNNLGIHYSPEKVDNVNIEANTETTAAVSDGADVLKDLQQALKEKSALEVKVARLQEKLSVCYAKEATSQDLTEEVSRLTSSLSEKTKSVDALKKRNSLLTEKVKMLSAEVAQKTQEAEDAKKSLAEAKSVASQNTQTLTETLGRKDSAIKASASKIKTLEESVRRLQVENEHKVKTLTEELEEAKKDLSIKSTEYSQKITKAKELTEKYKNVAKIAVDKYIDTKAIHIGVKPEEIKNKLPEGYSFKDIDRVCESLQEYQVNMSKLPFNAFRSKNIRVNVTESKEPIRPVIGVDDDVDDNLINLAGTI